jgi:hypothetical protein
MSLDERYITTVNLEPYFVDKQTGLPLANGKIYFWTDDQRNTPKTVYELTGAPPNYTYTALPNPITLSSVGTIQNAGGDNIALYYYPYDDNGDIELYYIEVFSDTNVMVPQFTREAWPNVSPGNDPATNGEGGFVNALSNPQFVEVLFDVDDGLVISYTGNGTTEVEFAPGWFVRIEHTNAGSVTINRNSVIGSSVFATNPPYTLSVAAGANIAVLEIVQRLTNNPGIWASTTGIPGYIAASIMLGNNTSAEMYYQPSVGTERQLLNYTNNSGLPKEYNNTTLIPASDNTANSNVGYVDIAVRLNNAGTSLISSIQVVGLATNEANIRFDQEPANRQRAHLAWYYKPQLAYKPIPSYLIGWDFPQNPAQFLGDTVAASAFGANKSRYFWDQTIIFQGANSGVGITRAPSGALRVTTPVNSQFALIQYLDQKTAREALNNKIAAHLRLTTNRIAQLGGVVSLWYTTDANLPTVTDGTNDSLVLTLGATGKPATFNGANWFEVPRSNLGDAFFDIDPPATTLMNDIALTGWNLNDPTLANGATFFAIVVGFELANAADYFDFHSIGLCAGEMATPPAPKTPSEVLLDSQRFYWKTFLPSTVPVQNAGVDTGYPQWPAVVATAGVQNTHQVLLPTPMRATPTVTLFNPANTNASIRNFTSGPGDVFSSNTTNVTAKTITLTADLNGVGAAANILGVHLTADARLGVVN